MLDVRRSLVTRRSIPGAGAANGRPRPAVSVFIEVSYSKICASLPLGSLSGINWRSLSYHQSEPDPGGAKCLYRFKKKNFRHE